MSIIDKIESITASRNTIRTKMVTAGQATRTDKLATLANNLSITDTSDATATAADIAEGKTAYVEGAKITGTSTKDADTSDATATAGDILSGATAYVNGSKLVGTIQSKAAQTYIPGAAAQTIASGQYLNGAQIIQGSSALTADNIKQGTSIFGVTGTFTSDATATAEDIAEGKTAYVNGIKITGIAIIPDPVTVKSFSTATDEEITAMLTAVRAGNLSYFDLVAAGWIVGAERPVSLSAMTATGVGESHVAQNQTWVILHGKDFFDLADGGKNLFVVGLKNVLSDGTIKEEGYMNSTHTNSGGWNSCARRTWCNNVFKNAIPSEELNWFKEFKVKTSNGSQSTAVTESTDFFSLPSRAEVFGGSNASYTSDAEGTNVLSYYSIEANRIKKAADGSGIALYWWLRSPNVSNSTNFCDVKSSGNLGSQGAGNDDNLSPFGCM